MNNQIPQGLDPTAFLLTKAIKNAETPNHPDPYNAVGDNGKSFGAYQIQRQYWSGWAKQYLGDANAQPTEENQNKLAYMRVKDLLRNHSQSEVASIWNSGRADPNAGGVGYNPDVKSNYNVPAYVEKVKNNYLQLQQQFVPTANAQTPDTVQNPEDQSTSGFLGTNPNDSLYGKILDNSITRGIQGFFPGQKVGQAIGTLGGYMASGFDPNYDISAPTPLQVAGDVAQGALMVGTGMPEGSTGISAFGKTIPVMQAAETAIGRIGQNALVGGLYGTTGALSSGSTNIGDIAKQGAIGSIFGGSVSGALEGVNSLLGSLPTRLTKSVLPQLNNEDTINYAIKNVKLGTADTMVNESQKALNSFNTQIDGILSHPQFSETISPANKVLASDILSGVKKVMPRSEYDVPEIISKLKTLVPSESATLTKLGKGGELFVEEANTLRQAIDKATYKVSPLDSSEIKTGRELAEAVGNSIREKVKKIAPETIPIFDSFSKEIRLYKALSKLKNSSNKGNIVSMKDLWSVMTGAIAGGVPGAVTGLVLEKAGTNPAIKMGAAKVIQKVAPTATKINQAVAQKASLIPGSIFRQ